MIKHLLNRAKEIVHKGGAKAYIFHIKRCLYLKPFLDELWYMINYYLRPSRRIIKKVQGANMLLDLSDGGINRDLFLYGCREPECTKIFKAELSEGMTVVDIGANIGYYVLIESQLIGNSGRIYAIEPEPRNFKMLKRNVEMNSYTSRIKLYNMAISDKPGKSLFGIASTANAHRLFVSGGGEDKAIEVQTATLDKILGDVKIDVIRMDPEGGEWLIFKGMRRILRSNKPLKLFIEVHPKLIKDYGGNAEAMLRILAEVGFKIKFLVIWEPSSHFLIPYIKGKAPSEKCIAYDMPLDDFLINEQIKQFLTSETSSVYEPGYKLFLERT